jgi:hypothetical protein
MEGRSFDLIDSLFGSTPLPFQFRVAEVTVILEPT